MTNILTAVCKGYHNKSHEHAIETNRKTQRYGGRESWLKHNRWNIHCNSTDTSYNI